MRMSVCSLLAVAGLLTAGALPQAAEPNRPNVILILADDKY